MAIYQSMQDLIGHTPLVRLTHLGYPEGARVFAKLASQRDVPGFYLTRIDYAAANSRLKKDGVDAALLQLVENPAQLFFLLLAVLLIGGLCLWPVEPTQCGKPNSSHFVLRSRHGWHEQLYLLFRLRMPLCDGIGAVKNCSNTYNYI